MTPDDEIKHMMSLAMNLVGDGPVPPVPADFFKEGEKPAKWVKAMEFVVRGRDKNSASYEQYENTWTPFDSDRCTAEMAWMQLAKNLGIPWPEALRFAQRLLVAIGRPADENGGGICDAATVDLYQKAIAATDKYSGMDYLRTNDRALEISGNLAAANAKIWDALERGGKKP